MKTFMLAVMLAAATALSAHAQRAEVTPASHESAAAYLGGIREWRPDGNKEVLIESRSRKWYRARLSAPCAGINGRKTFGFVMEPDERLDRFDAIVVDGQICKIAWLELIDKPM